jgi:hypothetical protein
MNTSGEAADQVMRMMLNGAEVLVKLSGSGAKNAAVLLYSIAREQKKTKGAARLESMLRSGKPLKVYTFRDSDLPKFKEVAKQYGILYTVLKEKDKTGGVFDVMVRAEDESKIARITERFNLARVDTADLRAEIIREKEEIEKDEGKNDVPENDKPEKSADEKLADEILGKPIQKEENEMENPTAARTETTRNTEGTEPTKNPSEHSSEIANPEGKSELPFEGKSERKPSVRKKLDEIKRERSERAKDRAKTPEIARDKGSKASKPKER